MGFSMDNWFMTVAWGVYILVLMILGLLYITKFRLSLSREDLLLDNGNHVVPKYPGYYPTIDLVLRGLIVGAMLLGMMAVPTILDFQRMIFGTAKSVVIFNSSTWTSLCFLTIIASPVVVFCLLYIFFAVFFPEFASFWALTLYCHCTGAGGWVNSRYWKQVASQCGIDKIRYVLVRNMLSIFLIVWGVTGGIGLATLGSYSLVGENGVIVNGHSPDGKKTYAWGDVLRVDVFVDAGRISNGRFFLAPHFKMIFRDNTQLDLFELRGVKELSDDDAVRVVDMLQGHGTPISFRPIDATGMQAMKSQGQYPLFRAMARLEELSSKDQRVLREGDAAVPQETFVPAPVESRKTNGWKSMVFWGLLASLFLFFSVRFNTLKDRRVRFIQYVSSQYSDIWSQIAAGTGDLTVNDVMTDRQLLAQLMGKVKVDAVAAADPVVVEYLRYVQKELLIAVLLMVSLGVATFILTMIIK